LCSSDELPAPDEKRIQRQAWGREASAVGTRAGAQEDGEDGWRWRRLEVGGRPARGPARRAGETARTGGRWQAGVDDRKGGGGPVTTERRFAGL